MPSVTRLPSVGPSVRRSGSTDGGYDASDGPADIETSRDADKLMRHRERGSASCVRRTVKPHSHRRRRRRHETRQFRRVVDGGVNKALGALRRLMMLSTTERFL